MKEIRIIPAGAGAHLEILLDSGSLKRYYFMNYADALMARNAIEQSMGITVLRSEN